MLHAHSTWSYDGSWSLAGIARLFGSFGINYVMMTEHDTGFKADQFNQYKDECARASTSACTLVPGIEYSSPDNRVHILTWGVDAFLGEHRSIEATLNDVRSAGGVAVFAHPIRRDAWMAYEDAWTPLLNGIEIWNRKSDGMLPSDAGMKLREKTGLPGTVGVDFHSIKQAFPLFHKLKTSTTSGPNEVIDAIRTGALTPQVLGQPLLDENGKLRSGIQNKWTGIEKLRRKLRRK
jgi:predicted metal-dependent phosphoesterase TrpH